MVYNLRSQDVGDEPWWGFHVSYDCNWRAIVSYIPVAQLASKIGRRRTIQSGVLLLASCFIVAFVYTMLSDMFHSWLYVVFFSSLDLPGRQLT